MTEIREGAATTARVDLGLALGSLLRRYLESAHDVLADLPGGPRGFQVLSVAAAQECRNQAAIATSLGLDRTVMTYLVDDLEKAGLVERRPDPADRRSRQVVLTGGGRETVDAVAARLEQVERHLLGGLSDADAAQFRALLDRVVETGPPLPTDLACSV